MNPLMTVKNLSKYFGEGCSKCDASFDSENEDTNICPHCGTIAACKNVSIELFPGEVLGIVGESGSGKSTLVKILHFDFAPTEGEMYIDLDEKPQYSIDEDFSLDETDEQEISKKEVFALNSFRKRQIRNSLMGIVYQSPSLGLKMKLSSSGNVVERMLMAGNRHVGQMREKAKFLFNKTEVPTSRMDEPPRNFSGGMQQRVQIAKALSNKPLFLFLDEVTTGLDVSVQARVLDLIRGLQREFQPATLVVSHDLGVIRLLTQRTIVMKNGAIVESGLTDQVLENPQHPYTQLLVSSVL